MVDAMSMEELEAYIASFPPDPPYEAAIELLTDGELEMALDGLLSRRQILAIGRKRAKGASNRPSLN